jgi:hypothetical protein
MDNTDTKCEPESESQLEDCNCLLVEDARSNFFQLEDWMSALDLKASIIIAIDAIILSSLEQTTNFSHQVSPLRFEIVLAPFLSIEDFE